MSAISIEPGNTRDVACECCGGVSRTVTGFLRRDGDAAAAYVVRWTLGKVGSHGATFDLILGQWGDGTSPADRVAVALDFRRTETGPAFMVVDAGSRAVAQSPLVGQALTRDEAMRTPAAKLAFEMVDAIWLQDARIRDITERAG